MGNTHLHSKQDDINAACLGFRDTLLALSPKPIVALDAEWDTLRNGRGEIVGKKGRVALVILSARVAPESYKTLLLRTHNRATLPVNLVHLLMDRRFTFTGRCIGADFSKLSKDFSCDVHSTSLLCDIGPLARSRNLCHSSTTLEDIVLASTGFRLPKDQAVRCSMWSARDLSADQLEYAARDGVASIMAHNALQAMPNHSCRLACDKADFGCLVDLVPATGSVAIMNSRGARGTLLPRVPVWTNPAKVGARSVNLTATRHVVRITEVLAPGYTLPKFMSTGGAPLSLQAFGEPPFELVVTLSMLAPRVENASPFPAALHTPPTSCPILEPPTIAGLKASVSPVAPAETGHDFTADCRSEAGSEPGNLDDSSDDGDMENELRSLDLMEAAARGNRGASTLPIQLDTEVYDFTKFTSYSSVLGDAFHFIDRPKVAVHHSAKKAYKQAFGEAWLPYSATILAEVQATLAAAGMTAAQIKRKRFWSPRWFRRRVPSYAPEPSILYKRVRGVFVLFGNQLDVKTSKPLFNDTAWAKANNVLKEILAGHGSDPPGIVFYHPAVSADGSIRKDRYGLTIYDCVRGNGMVECIHKQLVDCFGRWRAGPRLAKVLLQEWRHRFNQRMSERRRAGFPKIGHYDTWLIDELQLLVWLNHGVDLFPNWSNSSHYISTPEQMDFVSMQNEQCTAIVNSKTLSPDVKLTADMRFLAKQTGTILPFFARVWAR